MITYLLTLVILGGLAAFIASRPDEFGVSRSITMAVMPEKIFDHINDLYKWNAWSPWAKIDPNAKTTFEGPAFGVGAVMRWAGNREVGEGSMTIVESNASTESNMPSVIKLRLDFIKPMPGTSDVTFTLTPLGGQTNVTWAMQGKSNFVGKAIGLVFNCEKMVGQKYQEGLSNLKKVAEGQ